MEEVRKKKEALTKPRAAQPRYQPQPQPQPEVVGMAAVTSPVESSHPPTSDGHNQHHHHVGHSLVTHTQHPHQASILSNSLDYHIQSIQLTTM